MALTTSFVSKSSLAFVVVAALAGAAGATPHWGALDADDCTAIGFRQHNAILWDLPWWTNWEAACWSTPHPDTGRTPDRCVQVGFMYGEWDLEDTTCPHWEYDYNNWLNGCIPNMPQGTHREAYFLWDIPSGMDWEDTCNSTPATISGHSFSAPEYCTSCGFFQICGVFMVPATYCPGCGDGACSGGETCGGCPSDCGPCPYCGDGTCNGNEYSLNCPQDCVNCGDGICGDHESCSSCPDDCPCGTTCSGSPAGSGAGYFSIGVKNPYDHCAVTTNLVYANSSTEAYNCTAAVYPSPYIILTNPPTLTQYWYANWLNANCDETLVPAFSVADAEYCADYHGWGLPGRCDD